MERCHPLVRVPTAATVADTAVELQQDFGGAVGVGTVVAVAAVGAEAEHNRGSERKQPVVVAAAAAAAVAASGVGATKAAVAGSKAQVNFLAS